MQDEITMRWLGRGDVLASGGSDFVMALQDVQESLALFSAGQAGMEPESVLPMGADPREKAYGLPAWIGGRFDSVGIKWTVHRAAALSPGLPSSTSLTVLNARSNGRPLGLVESAHLTCMRTAAVSALAMDRLLPGTPRQVTVLGAGAQARCHLGMLAACFPSARVTVWNRTTAKVERLLAQHSSATNVPLLADAVAEADCILCCTSATSPILGRDAVRPGRLIVQVGFNEVTFEAIASTDIVAADAWGIFAERSAKSLFQMYRAGQFRPQDMAVDLATLAAGHWRSRPGASLYFSSFGLNFFDIALASRVLQTAAARGIGQVLTPFRLDGDAA